MKPPRSVILFSYVMLFVMFLSSLLHMFSLMGISTFLYFFCADWTWLDETVKHCGKQWGITSDHF